MGVALFWILPRIKIKKRHKLDFHALKLLLFFVMYTVEKKYQPIISLGEERERKGKGNGG